MKPMSESRILLHYVLCVNTGYTLVLTENLMGCARGNPHTTYLDDR
jgi:hypothetical protein